jgi:hypothetical protein
MKVIWLSNHNQLSGRRWWSLIGIKENRLSSSRSYKIVNLLQ